MKNIKAAILGGIILFIWSYISWMLLPWHNTTLHQFQDSNAVMQAIQTNAPQSGVYLLPSMQSMESAPLFVFASVKLGATSANMTQNLIISFVTYLVAAFFVSWLLCRAKGLSYLGRVFFVIIFALSVGIITYIPAWNWFGFDLNYTLVGMADLLIGWFLAGLVLARICRN